MKISIGYWKYIALSLSQLGLGSYHILIASRTSILIICSVFHMIQSYCVWFVLFSDYAYRLSYNMGLLTSHNAICNQQETFTHMRNLTDLITSLIASQSGS